MELNLNEPQSHGGSTSRLAIECPRAVLEQILAHVDRGFYSCRTGARRRAEFCTVLTTARGY